MGSRGLRCLFVALVIAGFFTLFSGIFGSGKTSFYENLPPIPEKIVSQKSGKILGTSESINRGQEVFRRSGLMSYMSSLGHGAYLGIDTGADALRRLTEHLKEISAYKYFERSFSGLSSDDQTVVFGIVQDVLKTNNYDAGAKILNLPPAYAHAWANTRSDYVKLFTEDYKEMGLRKAVVTDVEEAKSLADWFIWQAWISVTPRPDKCPLDGKTISVPHVCSNASYTNNWPPYNPAGNTITNESINATYATVAVFFPIFFLVIIAYRRYNFGFGEPTINLPDLSSVVLTASQKDSLWFFALAGVLFLLQTIIGGLGAHYYVEPGAFYPGLLGSYSETIAKLLPFEVVRALHIQLAILWIASAWMGAGLFLAPLIGGYEPKYQAAFVKFLFLAVLIAGLGDITGIWLNGQRYFGENTWFWFGTQGWEYFELGRVWQILILTGLVIFCGLVYRAIQPALKQENDIGGLVHLFLYSVMGITVFYVFGLFFSSTTHITIAEYWRWLVVHLWVEGAFEFFVVVTLGFILATLRLVPTASVLRASYFQLILVTAGIIGTGHHYYWVGASPTWLMLGSVFSTLEVVPLTLLLFEAVWEYVVIRKAGQDFKFALVFAMLIAVALWNFFGAGVLGVIINVPWTNYYAHGTFLTPAHGHAAMFGVFGLFALTLIVFCLQIANRLELTGMKLLKFSFGGLMVGLAGMVIILFAVGYYQVLECWNFGYHAARSLEFYQQPHIKTLLWMRMFPDALFIVSALGFVAVMLKNILAVTLKIIQKLCFI